MRFDLNRAPVQIVYDTGCGVTLIDRTVIARELVNAQIKTLPATVLVRGIGARRHASSEFLVVNITWTARSATARKQHTSSERSTLLTTFLQECFWVWMLSDPNVFA